MCTPVHRCDEQSAASTKQQQKHATCRSSPGSGGHEASAAANSPPQQSSAFAAADTEHPQLGQCGELSACGEEGECACLSERRLCVWVWVCVCVWGGGWCGWVWVCWCGCNWSNNCLHLLWAVRSLAHVRGVCVCARACMRVCTWNRICSTCCRVFTAWGMCCMILFTFHAPACVSTPVPVCACKRTRASVRMQVRPRLGACMRVCFMSSFEYF